MSEPGSPKMQFDVVSLRLRPYEFVVDTDEPDGRLVLLHDTVRKYGTVFNTVAPAPNPQACCAARPRRE
jgi:hypothetical protein